MDEGVAKDDFGIELDAFDAAMELHIAKIAVAKISSLKDRSTTAVACAPGMFKTLFSVGL